MTHLARNYLHHPGAILITVSDRTIQNHFEDMLQTRMIKIFGKHFHGITAQF